MQTTTTKRTLSLVLCIVLIAALALFTTGCNDNNTPTDESVSVPFTLIVEGPDGERTDFQLTSDKKTVGEALETQGIIAGEEGPYGLYIKTVNGITLDYEKDGMYWSFYIGEDYAVTGIDQTDIVPNTVYTLKAEAAQ